MVKKAVKMITDGYMIKKKKGGGERRFERVDEDDILLCCIVMDRKPTILNATGDSTFFLVRFRLTSLLKERYTSNYSTTRVHTELIFFGEK